ncbi:unnamed protein product (mitochondrion) [Plasmodiophora brassicae]|uniref:Uncharacterized protein n=1 Tax=Plasmodiophora brassicae TaxID=37360 RepID=A0A0G4IMA5_PLABS|nr:hypothetical protein PBRA_004898 [Plasmodiophora brassicae]SPQ99160.1 unnamed protein product [Plasmodiophora brassicae]
MASFASSSPLPFGLGNPFSWSSMTQTSYITKRAQSQLAKVYMTLAATVLAAAAGSYSSLKWNVFTDPSVPSLLTFVVMMALTFMQPSKSNEAIRFGMLMTFGFLDGCVLAPLIGLSIRLDPSVLVTALLSTTLVFMCFSISALTSSRRSLLYLGGILSSTVSFMLLASLLNVFFRSTFVPWMQIYLGLVVFCGFIMFDTQLMIEQILSGNDNYITMALNLFVDLVAVFVRILIILLNNTEKKRDEDHRRSRHR